MNDKKIYINKKKNKNKIIKELINERNIINKDINKKDLYKDFTLNNSRIFNIFNDIIKNNLKILVITDFDCDGTTSALILYYGLKGLNINNNINITKRKEGYGINIESIKKIYNNEYYDAIITADLGITNKEEVKILKDELKVKHIIITDHHTIQKELFPDKADEIINPKKDNKNVSYYNISGGMVTYLLMRELYKYYNIEFDNDNTLFYFAIISIVGDMMPLTEENFQAVKLGLRLLNTEILNKQLRNFFDSVLYNNIYSAMDLSFGVVPIINSMSRLKDQTITLEYFTQNNYNEYLQELIDTNKKRKEIQAKYEIIAQELIIKDKLYNNNIIIIVLDDCPKGIVGLVSSFITNKYYVPSIVLTNVSGELYGGSGRSIPEINLFNAVNNNKELLYKFGGHSAAIGMAIKKDNLKQFVLNIEKTLSSYGKVKGEIYYECELQLNDITSAFVKKLYHYLAPFGMSNPNPLFLIKNCKIKKINQIGNHTFLLASNEDESGWEIEEVTKQILWFKSKNSNINLSIGNKIDLIGSITNNDSIILEKLISIK